MKQTDELDVFEAAGYYAGAADFVCIRRKFVIPVEWRREERKTEGLLSIQRAGKNKSKQPLSPGGRLASFFIYLFQHGSNRQKKTVQGGAGISEKHGNEERSTGRRKRRESESSLPLHSSCSGDKKTQPTSRRHGASKTGCGLPEEDFRGGRSSYGDPPRKGNRRASINGIVDSGGSFFCESLLQFEDRSLWKEDGSGWGSDSSSDLFDLPNCELVRFSDKLPL